MCVCVVCTFLHDCYIIGIFTSQSQVFFEMKCKPQPTNTWLFSHIIIISMSFPLWFDEYFFFHYSNQIKNHKHTKATYISIDYRLYRLIWKLVNKVDCEIFIMLTFKAQWKQTYFSPLAIASDILNEKCGLHSYSLLFKWEYMLSKLNDRKKNIKNINHFVNVFWETKLEIVNQNERQQQNISIPWKQNTKKYECFTLH